MRGAAFLTEEDESKGLLPRGSMMVVDIGGTTTDVGLVLPSGFPREQAAYSELAGVRMVGCMHLLPSRPHINLRAIPELFVP
jgi:N-methylhydantoinase A/oxoprolinase/acetone carboxylase beta subunit